MAQTAVCQRDKGLDLACPICRTVQSEELFDRLVQVGKEELDAELVESEPVGVNDDADVEATLVDAPALVDAPIVDVENIDGSPELAAEEPAPEPQAPEPPPEPQAPEAKKAAAPKPAAVPKPPAPSLAAPKPAAKKAAIPKPAAVPKPSASAKKAAAKAATAPKLAVPAKPAAAAPKAATVPKLAAPKPGAPAKPATAAPTLAAPKPGDVAKPKGAASKAADPKAAKGKSAGANLPVDPPPVKYITSPIGRALTMMTEHVPPKAPPQASAPPLLPVDTVMCCDCGGNLKKINAGFFPS